MKEPEQTNGVLESSPSAENTVDQVRLYHRTKIKRIREIMRHGLLPGQGYVGHYGISDYLLDRFAPEQFKEIGLLRKNVIFAWYVARDEIGPLAGKRTTVSVDVQKARVFISDHHKSGVAIDGISAIYHAAFVEELQASNVSLKSRVQERSSRILSERLFEEDAVLKVFEGSPEKIRTAMQEMVSRLRAKMLRIGKPLAEAYWENIVPFSEFERDYRPNIANNRVSPNNKLVFYYPEAMIIGAVNPHQLEVISDHDPLFPTKVN